MGRRTLLVIASVLVAAMGTALIWAYVQSADERARGDWQDKVTVLLATEPIAAGSNAQAIEARTEPRQIPQALAPERPLTSATKVGKRTTTVPILAGQYIIEGQFTKAEVLTGVPENRMALAVDMQDPNRVASLLQPESHVAVYGLITAKTGTTIKMLLSDVRVIAVGGTTTARNADGNPAKVGTESGVSTALVTLDVRGKEATELMYYQQTGSLYFTLLGKGAKGDPSDTYVGPAAPVNPANG